MVETDGTSPDTVAKKLRRQFENFNRYRQADERLRWYLDQAERVAKVRDDDDAKVMLEAAQLALRHLQAGNVDDMLVEFDRMHQRREKLNINFFEGQARSQLGSAGGKTSKRGRGPLYLVLKAIVAEIGTAESDNVLTWWGRHESDNDGAHGAAMEYVLWFDGERYHYDLGGENTCTRKQIQDTLSKIRNPSG